MSSEHDAVAETLDNVAPIATIPTILAFITTCLAAASQINKLQFTPTVWTLL